MTPDTLLTNKIQRSFNRAAASYDGHCQAQVAIGEQLIQQLLAWQNIADTLLDVGCGSGLITELLANKISYQKFYGIDVAEQLLINAHLRLKNYGIELLAMDLHRLPFPKNYFNLIFSNMVLHWSTRLSASLKDIFSILTNNGIFAFSIPLNGTFRELTPASRNPFFTAEEIAEFLQQQSFTILNHKRETLVQHYADARSALQAIKTIGANQLLQVKHNGLRGKGYLAQILNPANASATQFNLTYEIGFFIARKNI